MLYNIGKTFWRLYHRCFWQSSTYIFFCCKWRWGQIRVKLKLPLSAANFNSGHNRFFLEICLKKFLKCYPKPMLFYCFTDTKLKAIFQRCDISYNTTLGLLCKKIQDNTRGTSFQILVILPSIFLWWGCC